MLDQGTINYIVRVRNKLTSPLQLNAPNREGDFEYEQYELTKLLEGEYLEAYDDAIKDKSVLRFPKKGNITVGIGFNMDDEKAKFFWEKAFKHLANFDNIYYRRAKLKHYEPRHLLITVMNIKRNELIKNIYKNYWKMLLPNEQLAIEDLYYNAPSLVRTNTNFFRNIVDYLDTGLFFYLKKAVYEIRERSSDQRDDKKIGPGIQRRRDIQALLLSTFECPQFIGQEFRIIAKSIDTWGREGY